VRHVFILAALTLTTCALPGASGTNSFMSAMHPTQEFCASRELTLDPTTKQCVTPAKTPAPAESVTGSLPQVVPVQSQPESGKPAPAAQAQPQPVSGKPAPVAPAQPQPQERQRAGATVPIEPDAVIYPKLSQDFELMSELAHFVRASGYRCDSISALEPLPPSRGFKLACNRSNYKYAIENKDGRSIVTAE
jgi:hypothetical protein